MDSFLFNDNAAAVVACQSLHKLCKYLSKLSLA